MFLTFASSPRRPAAAAYPPSSSPEEDGRKHFASSLQQAAFKMHLRLGGTQHAEEMFERMRPERQNAIVWTLFLSALIREGRYREAVRRFQKMQWAGVKPDRVTMLTMAAAYGELMDLQQAKLFHAHVYLSGYESDLIVGTALVNMYGKCCSFGNARLMFHRVGSASVVAWNVLITAFSQNGDLEMQCHKEALNLFREMILEGVKPNAVTFVATLNACSTVAFSAEGGRIHGYIIESGVSGEVIVGTALVKMYGKCGNLEAATCVFNSMEERDVVSWNTMVAACELSGDCRRALQIFWKMHLEGLVVNRITFMAALKACGGLADLPTAKGIHTLVQESVWCNDETLQGSMAAAYLKCGCKSEARNILLDTMVYPSVILWNAVITVCVQEGDFDEATRLLRMMQLQGMAPSGITFLACLDACRSLGEVRCLHSCISEGGLDVGATLASALVKAYGKFGSLKDAEDAFEKAVVKNAVLWNSMLGVYAQLWHKTAALRTHQRMQQSGDKSDSVTFISLVTLVQSSEEAMELHSRALEEGVLLKDSKLQNAVITMHGRVGNLEAAVGTFSRMQQERSTTSWNSFIGAYSMHGNAGRSLELLSEMQLEGLDPDVTTLTSVLFACSHAGLGNEGLLRLASLTQDYGLQLSPQHFGCVVDLLGRCGRLDECQEVLLHSPTPDAAAWNALTSSCSSSGDFQRAAQASSGVLGENANDPAAAYVRLAKSIRGTTELSS